jgi:ubiquinone/menaquinone biosynthesis C-methylase UbiE
MSVQAPREWTLAGDMAENYERYFVPAIFGPWAADLLDRAAPRPGERVLDVACATGIVARLAADRVGATGTVVGLDINPGMLAVARSATTPGIRIDWRQANAEDIPFPDQAFDLVMCQQGLQFFPNKPVALCEMRRVLALGGRLAISVWRDIEHIPGYLALAEALARHVSPESAAFMHMTGSLAEELLHLTEGAGFNDVTGRTVSRQLRFSSPEAFVWEMVQATPLAWMTSVNQADESTRADVIEDVTARLQLYVGDGGLEFPIEAFVVTARK